jgi:uncharacterized RDD family membrane protein YckC
MGQARTNLNEKFCFINCKTQEVYELYDGITFGRGSNANVIILDKRVSRIHLTLFLEKNGSIWLEDSSSNGTYLDGVRVSEKTKLTKNLRIKIGDTEFDFIMPADHRYETENNDDSKLNISKNKNQGLKLVTQFDENYSLYPPASMLKRFVANAIDSLLLSVANNIPTVLFKNLGLPDLIKNNLIFFSILLISFFYYQKTMAKNGQTIGKKVMKIMVIHTNGKKRISMFMIFLREAIFKPLFVVFSFFSVLLSKRKLAIHDYLSKTRVINLSER